MVSLPPFLALNSDPPPTNRPPSTDPAEKQNPNPISTINLMLMTHERFASFLPPDQDHKRGIANPRTQIQILPCLTAGSVNEVDGWIERAIVAGGRGDVCKRNEIRVPPNTGEAVARTEEAEAKAGTEAKEVSEGAEKGKAGKGEGEGEGEIVMYGRSFEDLDGNIWEVVWMSEGFLAGGGEGAVGDCVGE